MWELDYKESWAPKNWCFWTVVLEKTLESSLDCKEIKPVNPKENQSWVFIGRTDAKAQAPIIWLPDVKNWLTGKDPDAGKDWRQEEKRMTEDEVVEWHHRLDGHEFEQALGFSDGQGRLGRKESDTVEQLNWTESNCKTATHFLRHYFLEQCLLYSKIEKKILRFPKKALSLHMHRLSHFQYPPPRVVHLLQLINLLWLISITQRP